MTFPRLLELLLAASLPLATLVVVGRLLWTLGRSAARRRLGPALLALLGAGVMLLTLAAVLGPTFLHGLGQGGPEGWQGLLLLLGPVLIVFGMGLVLWRLAQAIERRIAGG